MGTVADTLENTLPENHPVNLVFRKVATVASAVSRNPHLIGDLVAGQEYQRHRIANEYGLAEPLLTAAEERGLANSVPTDRQGGMGLLIQRAAAIGAANGGELPAEELDRLMHRGDVDVQAASNDRKFGQHLKVAGGTVLGGTLWGAYGFINNLKNVDGKAGKTLGLLTGLITAAGLGAAILFFGVAFAPALLAIPVLAAIGGGALAALSQPLLHAIRGVGIGGASALAIGAAANQGRQFNRAQQANQAMKQALEKAAKRGHAIAEAKGIVVKTKQKTEKAPVTPTVAENAVGANLPEPPAAQAAPSNTPAGPKAPSAAGIATGVAGTAAGVAAIDAALSAIKRPAGITADPVEPVGASKEHSIVQAARAVVNALEGKSLDGDVGKQFGLLKETVAGGGKFDSLTHAPLQEKIVRVLDIYRDADTRSAAAQMFEAVRGGHVGEAMRHASALTLQVLGVQAQRDLAAPSATSLADAPRLDGLKPADVTAAATASLTPVVKPAVERANNIS